MYFISKNKKYWWVLPLLYTFLIIVLFFLKDIVFNIILYKSRNGFFYNVFIITLICLSTFSLFFYTEWKNKSVQKKILLIGLSLFLITINFRLQLSFQASAIFTLAVLVFFLFEKKTYRPNLFFISLFIYFGICTISLFWSENLKSGITYWREMTPLAFVPILFCFFRLEKNDFTLIALVIFRFATFFAFLSICSWIIQCRFLHFPLLDSLSIKKYNIGEFDSYAVVYSWSSRTHPTYNALILLTSLSFGWYYIFKKNIEDNISYVELAFLVFSTLLITIITASRFQFVGWVIVNVFGVLFVILKKKRLFTLTLSLLTVFLILFTYFKKDTIFSFSEDPIRACHYRAAVEGIKENTLLGTGLGNMTKYVNKNDPAYASLHFTKEYVFWHEHPHNEFLGDFLQTGILGFVSILFVLGTLFYYGFKQRNWLLIINTIIFFILMNIEMPLIYVPGIFYFALFFSFLVSKEGYSNATYKLKKNQIHE